MIEIYKCKKIKIKKEEGVMRKKQYLVPRIAISYICQEDIITGSPGGLFDETETYENFSPNWFTKE